MSTDFVEKAEETGNTMKGRKRCKRVLNSQEVLAAFLETCSTSKAPGKKVSWYIIVDSCHNTSVFKQLTMINHQSTQNVDFKYFFNLWSVLWTWAVVTYNNMCMSWLQWKAGEHSGRSKVHLYSLRQQKWKHYSVHIYLIPKQRQPAAKKGNKPFDKSCMSEERNEASS